MPSSGCFLLERSAFESPKPWRPEVGWKKEYLPLVGDGNLQVHGLCWEALMSAEGVGCCQDKATLDNL